MIQDAIYPVSRWVNFLNAATATNGVPTLITDGIDLIKAGKQARYGRNSIVRIRHSATGARTFKVNFWGYAPDEVDEDDTVIASSAGWIDTEESFTLASTTTNGQVGQVYICLTAFERLYAELESITGTATSVSCAIGLTDH